MCVILDGSIPSLILFVPCKKHFCWSMLQFSYFFEESGVVSPLL